MKANLRPKFIWIAFGLASILIGCLWVLPSKADVGNQPILPDGSSVKPEGQTPIIMQAERVTLKVRKATEADNAVVNFDSQMYGFDNSLVWFPAIAEVEAGFTMKNPTSESVSMTVWFPLASSLEDARWEDHPGEVVPTIKRFQVIVDGERVDYKVSEFPNPHGADKPALPWASFPVTFPAMQAVRIEVSYLLPAHRPEAKNSYLVMIFNYIFQTGAGWAGPIGKAELVVNLPYPASPKTIVAMPEGGKIKGQQVSWTWESLEPGPEDDFSISLIQPERWEELQADQAAVQAKPRDGQAWLNLCDTYFRLSYTGWHKNPGFGEVYPALGLEACQEAARYLPKTTTNDGRAWLKLCAIYYELSKDETYDPALAEQACQEATQLLPGDPGPHYGLAVLYLSGLSQNPSPAELQPVLDEFNIGQELEAVRPPSEEVYRFQLNYLSPAEFITEWLNSIGYAPTDSARQTSETRENETTVSLPEQITWKGRVIGGPYSADSNTLLLLHLDGSYDGDQGETGIATGTDFTAGHNDQGVLIDDADTLTYTTSRNLNRTQGAIEFWMRPNWDGDDGQSYVFFEVGQTWENRMRIMKDGANNLRFMVWDSVAEYGVSHDVADWQAGEWHHIAVTWQDTEIALYVDGREVDSSGDAQVTDSLGYAISIGSSSLEKGYQANAVIDELRISDIPRLGDPESTPTQTTPTSAPTHKPSLTPTPLIPENTQPSSKLTESATTTAIMPIPSVTPQPSENNPEDGFGNQLYLILGITALLFGLVVVGFLVTRRMRGRSG